MTTENEVYHISPTADCVIWGDDITIRDKNDNAVVKLSLPELRALYARVFSKPISNETPPGETRNPVVAEKRAKLNAEREEAERCFAIMERLPQDVAKNAEIVGDRLVIYWCDRPMVKTVMAALPAGKWDKTPANDGDKIDYTAVVDGVEVKLYGAEPPPSCRIVEVEEEVPASKRVVRKLVCAGGTE